MKKALSMLLVVSFLMTAIVSTAFAAGTVVTFTFGGKTFKQGETTVEVKGKSNSTIYISRQEMRDLVKYCPNLKKLILDYCYMDTNTYPLIGNLTELTCLRLMSAKGNPVEDISFVEDLIYLTQLDLNYNAISNIDPMENLVNLTSSNLGGNQLDGNALYALSGLTKLKTLHLYSNNIKSITALRSLTNLTHLNLQKNTVLKNFSATKYMKKLQTLQIQHTGCSDLSFTSNIPQLYELNIAGCPLNYDDYEELVYCGNLGKVTIGTSDDITVEDLFEMLDESVTVTDGTKTLPDDISATKAPKKSTPKTTPRPTAKPTKKPTARPRITAKPVMQEGGVYLNGRKITSARRLNVGNVVTFGSFNQNGTRSKTPLEWEVLDISGSEVLLITTKGIAATDYNSRQADVTWEDCSLRSWLNGSFYRSAFTMEERDYIMRSYSEASINPDYKKVDPGNSVYDKVFLLSTEEALAYYPNKSSRMCEATETAINDGARISADWTCFWFLRTPGSSKHCVSVVDGDGSIYSGVHVYRGEMGKLGCVRPCVWISFELDS